eukprot:403349617
MGCKRCCSVKCVSLTLASLSTVLLLLCGIDMYLVIRMKSYNIWNDEGDESMPEYDQNNSRKGQSIRSGLFYGTLILAILNAIIACMGLCTAIKRGGFKKLLTYSIVAFSSTIVTFGLALGVLMITITGKKYLDNSCSDKSLSDLQTKMHNYALYYLPYIDDTTTKLINTHMCTANCPCAKVDQNQWSSSIYNQAPSSTTNTSTAQNPVTRLRFDGTTQNFKQCYDKLVANKIIKPLSQNTLDIIYNYEMNKGCIGLCEPPLFNFYRNLDSGPPTQACKSIIQSEINKTLGSVAIITFISGFIIFISFTLQFGLWGRKHVSRRSSNNRESSYYQRNHKDSKIPKTQATNGRQFFKTQISELSNDTS